MLLEDPPQRLRIIKRENEGLPRDLRRHPCTVWISQSERTGTCLHEQPIRVPVIAAIKFDNEIPPGKSTSQADGRHRRLGTAVAETHLLHRWNQRFDALSHRHLLSVRNAKAGAALGGALDRPNNRQGSMPENRRPPGSDVIDVGIAIHVGDPRSGSRSCKEGGASHRPESTDWRVYATRNVLEGFSKQGFGPRSNAHVLEDCALQNEGCKARAVQDPGLI